MESNGLLTGDIKKYQFGLKCGNLECCAFSEICGPPKSVYGKFVFYSSLTDKNVRPLY